MTPPTPTEVEELARELRLQAWYSDPHQFARWILARFVRREEHERVVAHIESSHNEVVCSSTLRHANDGGDPVPLLTCMTWESHRLRAELRGQRCDGSGNIYYRAPGQVVGEDCRGFCPRCPACKPTDDGGRARESVSVLEQHCSDADLETIGKMRDESYADGYSAGRDDAARLNVQEVVHVVKLHDDTLRALVTGLLMAPTGQDATPAVPWTERAWDLAGTLLAKLKETKG